MSAFGPRRETVGFALALALGLAACSGSDAGVESAGDPAPSPASVPAASPATTTTPGSSSPATLPDATSSTPPPSNAPSSTVAARYDFSAVGPIIEASIADNDLDGAALVIVDRNDGVVFEEYWGEIDANRVSLVASSSKMLVAGVLLRLADQGLIDLDAPVADVVDWGAGNPTITPAQLVSNSSGLVGLGPNVAYPPYLCQFLPIGTLQECAEAVFTTTNDDGDVIAPDTEFRYGGAQWQVAGAVAEVASGRSWAELIDDTYVDPCGVDSLAFNNHWTQFGLGFTYPDTFDPASLQATDNPSIEGGAYVSARDYADLLLMLFRDGQCGDEQVLSSDAIERMMSDRIGEVYGGSDHDQGYGMGWFVDRSTGLRTDPGAYGSVAWLDLDAGHGAFLLIEDSGAVGSPLAAQLFEPVSAALTAS